MIDDIENINQDQKNAIIIIIVRRNGPATFHPVTGHEGPEGE
jgi:hypothetical protein